jgi:hypothetical protein
MLALLNFSSNGLSGERVRARFGPSHQNTAQAYPPAPEFDPNNAVVMFTSLLAIISLVHEAIYGPLSMFSPTITNQSAPKEMPTIRAILASSMSPSFVPVTIKTP